MKIYFDNCSLQRPLDSKLQMRIAVEAEAVLGLLALCESEQMELVASEALTFEVARGLNLARKGYASEVLAMATMYIRVTEQVESRARVLVERGMGPLDALHLASAEEAQADYLCTCDDGFLRRAKFMADLQTEVVSPLELLELLGGTEQWQEK